MVTVCCCCVAGLSDTLRMKTAPWSTSLRASAAEMSGRDWSSSIRSSSLRPSTPPLRLISSPPKITPSVAGSEYGLETPTRSVITPILMVSCATTDADTAASSAASHFFMTPSSVEQIALRHPSYTKFHRLLQKVRLPLVVMGRAFDDVKGLVPAAGSVVDDARVRLRHRIVRRVLDRQERHADRARAPRPVGVRVVDRPLREPGPERRETADAHRPGIRGFGSSEIAPARLAIVWIHRGIHEAHVAHRAIGDEAALELIAFQLFQGFLRPRGFPPHAGELRFAEAPYECRRVRRPVRALRVVDVELEIALVGVRLVQHRRIDPLREHARARQVRSLEDHAVRRDQVLDF